NPRPPASLTARTCDPCFSVPILSAEQTQRIDLETIAAFEQPAQMSSVGSESWGESLACPNSDCRASFSWFATVYDRRRLIIEARAVPPLMLGTIVDSSTVTPLRSTLYSSTSRVVSGGLKFHCWRTISRNEFPSDDQRETNSCVRADSFSSNTNQM